MIHFYLLLIPLTLFQNPKLVLVEGLRSDVLKKSNEFAKIFQNFELPMEFKIIVESFLSFESPNMYDLESNLILPTNDGIKLIDNRKLIKLWNKQYGSVSTSDLQLIINAKFIKMFSVYVNKFWNIGKTSKTLVKIFNWISPIILSFYQNSRDCLYCIFNKLSQSLRDVPNFKCSCLMGYGVKELLEIIVTLLHNNEDIN